MTAEEIRRIYSLGASLGIVGKDHDDDLHMLVEGLTGKSSIKELDSDEYRRVLKELQRRASLHKPAKKKKQPSKSGGITQRQISKVWQLMYELKKFDKKPVSTAIGQRLCGIIKKELHIDALPNEPFMWISYQSGSILIERLKKYVYNAEKRYINGH